MRKLILAAGFAAVASFGFAEDAYIESTGTQAILTDVLINGSRVSSSTSRPATARSTGIGSSGRIRRPTARFWF